MLRCDQKMTVLRKPLSRRRIWAALIVAIAADALQLGFGPLGCAFVDEAIDLAVMVALTFLVGFHPLFLPTFVLEFFPMVDMLPTWTGCTAVVLAMRRKDTMTKAPPPADVIDI